MMSPSLSMATGFASAVRQMAELSGRTLESLLRRQADRQAEAALFELDDRMLTDIGLHRSEILSVVRLGSDPTRIPR